MSLFNSGAWSQELAQMRRERRELEARAQNLVGPIQNIADIHDMDLSQMINRVNVATPTNPIPKGE